jgi:hypothetical protein
MNQGRLPFGALGAVLAILSCHAPSPAVLVTPAPTPPLALAPPAKPGASKPSDPWLGMYVASKEGEDSAWWYIAPRPAGAWLLTTFVPDGGNRITKVTLEPRSEGWSIRPGVGGNTGVLLRRPAREGGPWSLEFGEASVAQRLDADSTKLAARLSRGLRFVRLDDRRPPGPGRVEDAYTKDTIDVLDGMFTRLEIERHGDVACYLDVLVPMILHERGTRPSSPEDAGAASDIHVVKYMLLKTERHCPDAFDPNGEYEGPELGKDAGVTFFVRGGEPLGAVIVSYMYAGLFVAPSVGWTDVAAISKVAQAALSEQAE